MICQNGLEKKRNECRGEVFLKVHDDKSYLPVNVIFTSKCHWHGKYPYCRQFANLASNESIEFYKKEICSVCKYSILE